MNTHTSPHWPRLLAALATAAALSGCVSSGNKKARCPVPDGTRCMGLAEVYQRTETSSVPTPNLIDVSSRAGKKQARAERRQAKREAKRERAAKFAAVEATDTAAHVTHYAHGHWNWVPAEKGAAGDASADAAVSGDTTPANDTARPLPEMQHQAITSQAAYIAPAPASADPVRAPAQVMRIVVSAWEDDTGSLHMPSTIFTEIAPRRWKVGSPAIQSSAGFRLFEGLGTQTDATSDTAPRPTL